MVKALVCSIRERLAESTTSDASREVKGGLIFDGRSIVGGRLARVKAQAE